MQITKSNEIRISEKILLTIDEASAISSIGLNKLRELANEPTCSFVFYNGKKHLIKRKAFEKFIDENIEI